MVGLFTTPAWLFDARPRVVPHVENMSPNTSIGMLGKLHLRACSSTSRFTSTILGHSAT